MYGGDRNKTWRLAEADGLGGNTTKSLLLEGIDSAQGFLRLTALDVDESPVPGLETTESEDYEEAYEEVAKLFVAGLYRTIAVATTFLLGQQLTRKQLLL